MDQVAVVILNHNGKHLLAKFLPSVVQYSAPHRIILVDNASTDDSLPFIKQNYPDLPCICLDKNEGFARGYNLALQTIKAKYYALLNTDVEVTPQWMVPLLQLLEANPHIAACQPKLLSYNNKNKFDYAGAGGGFIDMLGYPFCRGRLFDTIEEDQGQYNDNKAVFWASGACLLIRAAVFWQLGGFDERLFAYYEEIDLCWRIQQQGLQVYYCGKSQVYHVGSATMGNNNAYKTYLNFRNSALVLYKNTPVHFLGWKHWLRFFLDLVAAAKALVQGQTKHSWAIVKAKVAFLQLKNKYQPTHQHHTINNMYRGLVPFAYFIGRKKQFSKLSTRKLQASTSAKP